MLGARLVDADSIQNRHHAKKQMEQGHKIIHPLGDRAGDKQYSYNEIEFRNFFVIFRWKMHDNTPAPLCLISAFQIAAVAILIAGFLSQKANRQANMEPK